MCLFLRFRTKAFLSILFFINKPFGYLAALATSLYNYFMATTIIVAPTDEDSSTYKNLFSMQ